MRWIVVVLTLAAVLGIGWWVTVQIGRVAGLIVGTVGIILWGVVLKGSPSR